jgi:hypothetical protein
MDMMRFASRDFLPGETGLLFRNQADEDFGAMPGMSEAAYGAGVVCGQEGVMPGMPARGGDTLGGAEF